MFASCQTNAGQVAVMRQVRLAEVHRRFGQAQPLLRSSGRDVQLPGIGQTDDKQRKHGGEIVTPIDGRHASVVSGQRRKGPLPGVVVRYINFFPFQKSIVFNF